eukprot:TRINITY_DN30352_c2_g2_i2.p1 TRINITY_DN30352_c2_g2~~TRINITY_DN30352_c2_g2_i2.p1  ORF type:complete len:339 (-),score=87.01 TRINITY_DN30352_c2_g2_i2:181-1155(-)
MLPGAVAVLLHAWAGASYEKECVPAWDYYPVLEALMARHELIYPSAPLDRLHSEKRYASALMPPTQQLQLCRRRGAASAGSWCLENGRALGPAVAEALARLRSQAAAAGLSTADVMVKQGLSWGGEDVARLLPSRVLGHLQEKVLKKLPKHATALTVLLQAKVDLVAELRWIVFEGKLRGCGWRTFGQARRGSSMIKAGIMGESESRKALAQAGLARNEIELRKLEDRLRPAVELVLAEATQDAGGETPQFLRVDLLMDRKGQPWLGERESWGADLMGGTYDPRKGSFTRQDPSRLEVARKMVARALRLLTGQKSAKSAKAAKV